MKALVTFQGVRIRQLTREQVPVSWGGVASFAWADRPLVLETRVEPDVVCLGCLVEAPWAIVRVKSGPDLLCPGIVRHAQFAVRGPVDLVVEVTNLELDP